jgi:hypothetical protein
MIDVNDPNVQTAVCQEAYLPGFVDGFNKTAAQLGLPTITDEKELESLLNIKQATDAQAQAQGAGAPYQKLASLLLPPAPVAPDASLLNAVKLSPALLALHKA